MLALPYRSGSGKSWPLPSPPPLLGICLSILLAFLEEACVCASVWLPFICPPCFSSTPPPLFLFF